MEKIDSNMNGNIAVSPQFDDTQPVIKEGITPLSTWTFVPVNPILERGHDPDSVLINGVRWATRNLGAPGQFVSNPEDIGLYYQWGSSVGWESPGTSIPVGAQWRDWILSSNVWSDWAQAEMSTF